MSPTFDLNNPLTAQIVSQGQALGYSPMQIAAVASRPYDENGGNTNGTPGDNGSAFGGMQWRNERFTGLKNLADGMGLPWDSPVVQAKYIYDELGGAEARAGNALKAATTPEDATKAIMSYVRPKNWNVGYDNINHGQNTLDRTSQIAAALTNGQAPQAGAEPPMQEGRSVAPGGAPEASQGLTAGIPPVSFGTRLQNLGAALMARDNPQGASALHTLATDQQQQDLLASGFGQWKDAGISPSGKQYVQTNAITGAKRYVDIPANAQVANKDLEPSQKERQMYEDNDKAMGLNADVIDAANTLRKHIAAGDVKMGWDDRAKALVANYTGNSTPQSVDIKNAEAIVNQQVGNIISGEKGPGTKFKFQQAMGQILPTGGQFDSVTFLDGLDRVVKLARNQYGAASNQNASLLSRKPTIAPGLPDSSGNLMDAAGVRKAITNKVAGWDSLDSDLAGPAADFRKNHFAKSGNGTTTQPSFGSFLPTYQPN